MSEQSSSAVTMLHPTRAALHVHCEQRARIIEQRTGSRQRWQNRKSIAAGDRTRDPAFTEFLRGKLAHHRREHLAPWCAIVAFCCYVRKSTAAILTHEDFRLALRSPDGWMPCDRTVRNVRHYAEEIGFVVVDPDFDDCRRRPRSLRNGQRWKWPRVANQYRPGPLLEALWNEWQAECSRRRAEIEGREITRERNELRNAVRRAAARALVEREQARQPLPSKRSGSGSLSDTSNLKIPIGSGEPAQIGESVSALADEDRHTPAPASTPQRDAQRCQEQGLLGAGLDAPANVSDFGASSRRSSSEYNELPASIRETLSPADFDGLSAFYRELLLRHARERGE